MVGVVVGTSTATTVVVVMMVSLHNSQELEWPNSQ